MPQRVAKEEFARLSSLYRYGVLDTEAEPAIDLVLQHLVTELDVPVAQLVFADAQRFWSKSTIGPVDPVHLRGQGPLETLLGGGPDILILSDGHDAMPRGTVALRSFAGLRMTGIEDEPLGVLFVADAANRDLASSAPGALMAAAAAIRTVIDSGRRAREDESTGALKRDPFLDQARRLIQVSRSARQWTSLVTLDLAPFRMALEGKAAGLGSLAIRHMGDLGRAQVRGRDSFGRLGEDLFAVLLTDTDEAGARMLAQRLARYLERGWTDAGLAADGLEIGIISIRPSGPADTIEALLERVRAERWSPAADTPTTRVA